MDKLKQNVKMRAVKCLAVVLVTVPFAASWYLWYAENTMEEKMFGTSENGTGLYTEGNRIYT